MPKTVAVAMIVKNEEALLARCLESVKGLPIYILDTGSIDRTVEIARRYTDNVFIDYVWRDRFDEPQNLIKSRVKEDFILSIDADEQLICSVQDVLDAAQLAKDVVHVTMVAEGSDTNTFGFGRLFRNTPDIYWCQAIHKHLNVPGTGEEVGNVRIMYGRSPAHDLDPDRSLRMLEQTVATEEKPVRNLYYLGREYFYKQRYQEAIDTFKRYFPVAHWAAELADAYLITAESYLQLKEVKAAADSILQAILINPNFKEAVQMMAAISVPENRIQWQRMARAANNEDVLWKRTEVERVDDHVLISAHNDDEALFSAITLMRVKPLVIIATDSWIQHKRDPQAGCGPEARRQETIEAMKLVGCPVMFMGIPDEQFTEEIYRERIKLINPVRIYAPAVQGGNEHHDIIGRVTKEIFGDRCELYTTYTKTELYTTGSWEIKPTPEEIKLKERMLGCYKSQLQFEWQRQLFKEASDKSEWLQ